MDELDIAFRDYNPVAGRSPSVTPTPAPTTPSNAAKPSTLPPKPPEKMHITNQFRDGDAMVCDLRAGERRLEIRVRPRQDTEQPWQVAMLLKEAAGHLPFQAVGPTKRAAFDALQDAFDYALTTEDWNCTKEALASVRII
jgi:hypothetical protein